jgi:hypothetical protein
MRVLELEYALLSTDLTSDMSIKSSVRHILHTDQPVWNLRPNKFSIVSGALLMRVRTVAYESRYVFVSSLDCHIDFIMKCTVVN